MEIGSLINLILAHANLDLDCLLKDMVTEEGIWNLDIFRIWLSEDIIRRIASIPSPDSSVGYDRIACIRSGSGPFL